MTIKIAFFDIDNTIYDGFNKRYNERTIRALKKAQENGLKICVCTSRPNDSMRDIGTFDLGIKWDAIIGSSGGTAKVDGKFIRSFTVNESVSARLFDYLVSKHITFEMIGLETRWICGDFNDSAKKFYDLFLEKHPATSTVLKHDLTQYHLFCSDEYDDEIIRLFPEIVFSRYLPFAVDVVPVMYKKGDGIDDVLDYFGLTEDEAIGFGDDLQDISIADHVKEFVAMENAKDEVKAVATYVTGHCSSDGVEMALEHFNLI